MRQCTRFLVLLAFAVPLAGGCSDDSTPSPSFISKTAVQPPLGKFFLARYDNRYAAIMLVPEPHHSRPGRQYLWYYQNDGSGVFTNTTASKGRGVVSEQYRLLTDPEDPHRSTLVLDGDAPELVCGGLRVEWSRGDWVYFHDYYRLFKGLEIAITDWDDIRDVKCNAPDLTWQKGPERSQSKAKD